MIYNTVTPTTEFEAIKTAIKGSKPFNALVLEGDDKNVRQVSYVDGSLTIVDRYDSNVYEEVEFVVSSKGAIIGLDRDGDSLIRITENVIPFKQEE